MTNIRLKIVTKLAEDIYKKKTSKPMLVAVSGITASGKTSFSNELAGALRQLVDSDSEVIRASIDSFHNSSTIRHASGKESWRAYYEDAHDYSSMVELLLRPLYEDGSRNYQLGSLDLVNDVPLSPNLIKASEDSFFIVDGTFLFKPELNGYWNYRVYLQTDFPIALKRGVKRDQEDTGGITKTKVRYLERYHKASRHYLETIKPEEFTDAVFNNNNLDKPKLSLA